MKKIIVSFLIFFTTGATALANNELTGDTKLACETILCLSSGTRPSECIPALRRFFSINLKKPWQTVAARRNFLRLCPSASADGMDSLADAIVQYSMSNCNATYLNRNLEPGFRGEHGPETSPNRVKITIISKQNYSTGENAEPHSRIVYAIRDNLPPGCAALLNHAFTDYSSAGLRYSGLAVPDQPTTIYVNTREDVNQLAAQYTAGHWIE